MKVEVVRITPEIAEVWLKTSKGNPRWTNGKIANRKKVDKIKQDILRGEWNPGNNSIAFDESMRLVDGHHRLMAIKEAGVAVESIVVYGVNDKGLSHVDENATRTVAQRLSINPLIPGVANLDFMAVSESGYYIDHSSEKIYDWYEKNTGVLDAIEVCKKGSHKKLMSKASAILAILHAMKCGVPKQILEKFTYCVNTGFSDGDNETAAIIIRNMLLDERGKRANRRDTMIESFCIEQGIKDFFEGTPRKKYYKSEKGFYNEILKRNAL